MNGGVALAAGNPGAGGEADARAVTTHEAAGLHGSAPGTAEALQLIKRLRNIASATRNPAIP